MAECCAWLQPLVLLGMLAGVVLLLISAIREVDE